jgi:hypothetical protein
LGGKGGAEERATPGPEVTVANVLTRKRPAGNGAVKASLCLSWAPW